MYKSHDLAEIKQSLNSLKAIVEVELDLHIILALDDFSFITSFGENVGVFRL